MNFLETHKEGMKHLGFWAEEYKSSVLRSLELQYSTEVLREWTIVDLTFNGDKALAKWEKRTFPLTDQQLKEKYGR